MEEIEIHIICSSFISYYILYTISYRFVRLCVIYYVYISMYIYLYISQLNRELFIIFELPVWSRKLDHRQPSTNAETARTRLWSTDKRLGYYSPSQYNYKRYGFLPTNVPVNNRIPANKCGETNKWHVESTLNSLNKEK